MTLGIQPQGWRVLTSAINAVATPSSFLSTKIFGNIEMKEAENIDIDIQVGNKKLAPFVSPISGGKVISKQGFSTKSVKAPRIRIKKPLNGVDFMEKNAGQCVYLNAGDAKKSKDKKIADELLDLKNRIMRRKEFMCAQALKGEVNYKDEEFEFNINYQMPEDNKPTLTLTDKWDSKGTDNVLTANKTTQIKSWKRKIVQDTGRTADLVVAGYKAIDALLADPEILKILRNPNMQAGAVDLERKQENGVTYVGRLFGLEIYEYNEQYEDEEGVIKDMIAPEAFIMIASTAEFKTFFAPVNDLDAGGNVVVQVFSKDWVTPDPSVYWMLAESRPLPAPLRPQAIIYATVL